MLGKGAGGSSIRDYVSWGKRVGKQRWSQSSLRQLMRKCKTNILYTTTGLMICGYQDSCFDDNVLNTWPLMLSTGDGLNFQLVDLKCRGRWFLIIYHSHQITSVFSIRSSQEAPRALEHVVASVS